jgi:hypothetical protein
MLLAQLLTELLKGSLIAAGILGAPGTLSPSVMPGGAFDCSAPRWVREPSKTGSELHAASLESTCRIRPRLGGDLAHLQAFSLEQLSLRGQILSGPDEKRFEGLPGEPLPGSFVKYMLPVKTDEIELTLWQDIHLATDGSSVWVSSTRSTRIEGKGDAALIRKADSEVVIRRSGSSADDEARVTFYTEIQKPWYAPESVFVERLKETLPAQFADMRDQAMVQASQNY